MSVSLANVCANGSDGLGIYFFKNAPDSLSTLNVLNINPQVSFSSYGPITATTSWTRLTGTFTPDSAYDHIVIGGFKDTNTLAIAPAADTGKEVFSYYFIDSVVVKKIGGLTWTQEETYCAGQHIEIPYEIYNLNFESGNKFIVQLSDSTGNFANAVNIGERTSTIQGVISCVIPAGTMPGQNYMMRIISTNEPDTFYIYGSFKIYKIDPPVITVNSPVMKGAPIGFETSAPPGAEYSWTGPSGFNSTHPTPYISSAQTEHNGVYSLTINVGGCTATSNIEVEVMEIKDTGKIILYPNLNDGRFTVEGFVSADQYVRYKVVNDIGQLILKDIVQTAGKHLQHRVIMPAVADGVYYLHLRADLKDVIIPFVVKH
jgi:hypothetical protein